MTIIHNMATTYGTFSDGDTIEPEWGNDINDTLDDKISSTKTSAQSLSSTLAIDTILEKTASHGVIIDSVTLKDGDVTTTNINSLEGVMGIGSANSKWKVGSYAYLLDASEDMVSNSNLSFYHDTTNYLIHNKTASMSGYQIVFTASLPVKLGTKSLYLKNIRYYVFNANGTNYVTAVSGKLSNEEASVTNWVTDTTDRTTALTAVNITASAVRVLDYCTDYVFISVIFEIETANAYAMSITPPAIEYYYA